MEYNVIFIGEDRRVAVAAGVTLLEAQRMANLPADAPCGFRGEARLRRRQRLSPNRGRLARPFCPGHSYPGDLFKIK